MVVRKAAHMAGHLNTPLVGLVENMSYVICPHCGERYTLFGKGDTRAMADAFDTPFLGEIGIDPRMAELGDQGAIERYENQDFDALIALGDQLIERAPAPKAVREN